MMTKQCSKCGEMYDYAVGECPACRYKGYRLVDPAHAAPRGPAPLATPAHEAPPAVPADHSRLVRTLAILSGTAMGCSLFMPWVQDALLRSSYLRILGLTYDNLSQLTFHFGDGLALVFVPALSALSVLGGAFLSKHRRAADPLLVGGSLGMLSGWQMYSYLTSGSYLDLPVSLGAGLPLFAGASLAAAGLGVWRSLLPGAAPAGDPDALGQRESLCQGAGTLAGFLCGIPAAVSISQAVSDAGSSALAWASAFAPLLVSSLGGRAAGRWIGKRWVRRRGGWAALPTPAVVEPAPALPAGSPEELLDAAIQLESGEDSKGALAHYRAFAERFPDHEDSAWAQQRIAELQQPPPRGPAGGAK